MEIGMETGEGTKRPSGPGDLGLRFGCTSFNQDSTYVQRQGRTHIGHDDDALCLKLYVWAFKVSKIQTDNKQKTKHIGYTKGIRLFSI